LNDLNTILQFPERCLLNKKITKAFFKRNFELTISEKTLLDDASAVIGLEWLASIGPVNANVKSYQDAQYSYEEIQVITVQSSIDNFDRNYSKIAELVQKYIPYQILLCIWNSNVFMLNTSDKRVNQNDNNRKTIESSFSTEVINLSTITKAQQSFIESLSFSGLDKTNLKTMYDAYTQRIIALQTAELSGQYTPRTQSRTQTDIENLEKIELLQKEILALQNHAKKETQLNQQVALNTQVQQKRKQIEQLKELLTVE
jgi:hypothetical protein